MSNSRYQKIECAYCGAMVITDEDAPVAAVDDDDVWAALKDEHDDDCEWVFTRAHRINVD